VRLVAITGGIEAADAFYTTLDQVTPEDVRAAAARLLTRERRTVAVLKGVRS
jgi:predicted Zn-dependent peptidase